mmetsp:Transcript_6299/g.19880  ORF Transcript_6299/g.19880 Transcript_6299/m.19880 type:complete len:180 (-) Transcript_6299:81-620(-)
MGNKSSLHLISYGADEVDEIAVDDAAPADERSRPLPVLRRDDGDGELDPDKFVPPDDERSDGGASDAWDLEEEVCPVCLEPWDLDQGSTLCVRCLRHVCAPCAGRCDRCPLCRGDYPGAAERRRLLEQHVIEGKRVAMTSLGECYLFGHDEGMAQSYRSRRPELPGAIGRGPAPGAPRG